jgi:hypothetical protein
MRILQCSAAVALATAAGLAHAQAIPVIDLPAATARTTQPLGAILSIRQLADGKVLVDDAGSRRLIVLDSTLRTFTTVLDSASGGANSYGRRPIPLIAYLSDSSLFADLNSRTVLVIDPNGRIARALAMPSGSSPSDLLNRSTGVDPKGRIVFVSSMRGRPKLIRPGVAGFDDSVAVMRVDLELRRVDSIGRISRPLARATAPTKAGGTTFTMFAIDPIRTVDEVAVLSDGSVALIRGQDYHIDWIRMDGRTESTPKMPFDWKRLTDEDKQKLIDSTRAAQKALLAADKLESEVTMMTRGDPSGSPPPGAGTGGVGRGGGRGDGAGRAQDPEADRLSEFGRGYLPRTAEVIPLSDIADYYPAIRPGAAIPDLDGNLWLLPTTSKQSQHGELVYDVVNAKGEIFERVRLPLGRLVAGFGKSGVVYMTSGDRTAGYILERTRLPRR